MSLQINVKLKNGEETYLSKMNERLGKLKTDEHYHFIMPSDNQAWLDDINTNPLSDCAHLKPKNKDMTMKQLTATFPLWTEVGVLSLDIGFGRTSEHDMKQILAFINSHQYEIKTVDGITDLIERANTETDYSSLLSLETRLPDDALDLAPH